MKNQLIRTGFILILFLAGCQKKKGVHTPYLRPLTSYIDYEEKQNNVTLRVKKLSPRDSKSLFGDRAKLLYKKKRRRQPIYPIQFSITNETDKPITLKPENVSLTLTPYQEVATRLEHNAALKVFGGILVTLVTSGLLIAGGAFAIASTGMLTALFTSIGATVSLPLLVAGVSAAVVTPFFLVIGTPVISTMRGMEAVQKNNMIKRELQHRTMQKELRINRGQTVDTLLFVKKPDYRSEFTVLITSSAKEKKEVASFDVELHDHNY